MLRSAITDARSRPNEFTTACNQRARGPLPWTCSTIELIDERITTAWPTVSHVLSPIVLTVDLTALKIKSLQSVGGQFVLSGLAMLFRIACMRWVLNTVSYTGNMRCVLRGYDRSNPHILRV
jgi:hypothetical protein